MHLNAKRPIFCPREHWGEIEKLSKAALMDMVWDYAVRSAGEDTGADGAMREFRQTWQIIKGYRDAKA